MKLPDYINSRNLRIAEAILLVLIAILGYGLIIIGAYHNFPNAEDYEVSIGSRDAGFANTMLEWMAAYDGRYSTNFLHATNPLVFNSITGFKIMNVAGVILLNISLYSLMHALYKKSNKRMLVLYSIFITLVFIGSVLSLRYTVYVMASSFVYLFSCSFVPLFLASLIKYAEAKDKKNDILYFLAASVFLIIGIGFSELYLAFYSTVIAALLAYSFLYNKQLFKKLLPICLIGISCILFFVLTPSIVLRIQNLSDSNAGNNFTYPGILLNSVKNYMLMLFQTIQKPIFIASVIYVACLFGVKELEIEREVKWKKSLLLTTLALGFVMTLAYYLPKCDQNRFPPRIYTPVALIIFLYTFLILFSTKRSYFQRLKPETTKLLRVGLLMVILTDFVYGSNNIADLRREYQSGELATFKIFMDARIDALEKEHLSNHTYKKVVIPEIKTFPLTIYELGDSETNRSLSIWNKYHEEYFRLDEVKTWNDTTTRFHN